MALRISSFEPAGIYLESRLRRRRSALAYGEVLTAERLVTRTGLRLHTRTSEPLRVDCRGVERTTIEDELRRRGVRVVDQYGAIITPTLADFEAELAREPVRLRQSYDDA
jgi:hypothetical protein